MLLASILSTGRVHSNISSDLDDHPSRQTLCQIFLKIFPCPFYKWPSFLLPPHICILQILLYWFLINFTALPHTIASHSFLMTPPTLFQDMEKCKVSATFNNFFEQIKNKQQQENIRSYKIPGESMDF